MKNKSLWLLLILVILLGLVFFSLFSFETSNVEAKVVGSTEFEKLILEDKVFVLNVHTPYEGEINGTDAVIEDWQNIDLYLDKLPKDKSTPIAVYCRSGRMSADAAKQLVELGYDEVYDLEGGMNAWKQGGRGIIQDGQ